MQHRNLRDRVRAFTHYGGKEGIKCACCGEDEFTFLSLDHVNGNGNTERAKLFGDRFQGGHHIYRNLRVSGYPPGYQVLCMNCQVGRRDNGGVCPHQTGRITANELLVAFTALRVGDGNTSLTESDEYRTAYGKVMRRGHTVRSINMTVAVERAKQRRSDRVVFEEEHLRTVG